jgi:NAD-dependent deacetylase
VHGNGSRAACLRCGAKEPIGVILAALRPGLAPTCQACGGLLKPDVVLFGEAVTAMPKAASVVSRARTLVVAGTSLQVHPAAGLVDLALARGARVLLLNREATSYDGRVAEVRREAVEDELVRMFP